MSAPHGDPLLSKGGDYAGFGICLRRPAHLVRGGSQIAAGDEDHLVGGDGRRIGRLRIKSHYFKSILFN
jgi:hypothetical protein